MQSVCGSIAGLFFVHNLGMVLVLPPDVLAGPIYVAYVGVAMSMLLVTFGLYHTHPMLTFTHLNPNLLVNETEDPDAIEPDLPET